MVVIVKDKRGKLSRKTNLNSYKLEIKKIDSIKENNKYYKNSTQWIKEKYTIKIEVAKDRFRKKYIIDSFDKSYKSYSKYKLTFLKNHLEKVA